MKPFPYRLSPDADDKPCLGLVVLQVDETIEQDFRRLVPAESARIHVTRIPAGDRLTPKTIAGMEAALEQATTLLPDRAFDALAYCCTSGTALIGAERVAEKVLEARSARAVTNPLSAALAAFSALGVQSIGMVYPYLDSVAGPIQAAFRKAGFEVPLAVGFGEPVESRVARIDPASVCEAALHLVREAAVDALFLSCTNLRTLDIIEDIEAKTGLPVLSSTQVLVWHLAQLTGLRVADTAPGRLFSL